jgi:alpha-tubulin suppressor-like RCC1 family protein
LGDGTTSNRSSPVSVIGGFTDWISAIGGGYHSVALRANGTLWAWGRNSEGQLGDNTTSSRSSPVSVVGGYTDWVSVSAGNKHVIGLRANGTLWSWGNGSLGQLGTNNITNQTSPVSVVGGFTDWTYVSLGQYNSFGLRA